MASISVDVDLYEFETDDLIEELFDRKRGLSKSQKEDLSEIIGKDLDEGIEIKTMKDEMKMEFFLEHFAKITLEDLETIVNR